MTLKKFIPSKNSMSHHVSSSSSSSSSSSPSIRDRFRDSKFQKGFEENFCDKAVLSDF